VIAQHAGKLLLEPIGQSQHAFHVGSDFVSRKFRQQSYWWQRELLFLDEMRMQKPGNRPRRLAEGSLLLRRPHEHGV